MTLFFLILVLSFLLQLFLPWWSLAIATFVSALLMGKKAGQTFLVAFLASGIVWLLMAAYIHFTKGDLMTNRIADLLSLHGTVFLYVGSFMVAAIVGGISALAGFYLKKAF